MTSSKPEVMVLTPDFRRLKFGIGRLFGFIGNIAVFVATLVKM
jgi:hypothetical protein